MVELQSALIEVTITEWPIGAPAKVITRSWQANLHAGNPGMFSHDVPLVEFPADYIRVELWNVVPADPDWLAATAHLSGCNGQPLGNRRPVRFYGRPSDIGTHIYFPASDYHPAYSVQLRITSGGLTDGDE